MTLEIIEQELLKRSDSHLVLKGIDAIWEPDLHTLKINLSNSDLPKDDYDELIFPLEVWCILDNETQGIPIFRLNLGASELGRSWNTEDITLLLDVVFPSSVCCEFISDPDVVSSDIEYIESNGKAVSGNFFDLLSDEEIELFADRESWYRYIRVSSDNSLSSSQYIDRDGKIISQEYIYYKYSNLNIFFDGGKTRLFNLSPDTMFVKVSGFADREKYYVKGDSDPVLIGQEVVHIKEVPSLTINPRSRDKEVFQERFNYSDFTIYCGKLTEDGESLISGTPKSINFVAYSDGKIETSNSISFGQGELKIDMWEWLEATTDLENYRDEKSNPVFFVSGKTTNSFTLWNAFREGIIYDQDNIVLKGDKSDHFTLLVKTWTTGEWKKNYEDEEEIGKKVVEFNLVSDGSDGLDGELEIWDSEDGTIIVSFSILSLSPSVKKSLAVLDSTGKANNGEFKFSPIAGDESSRVGFNIVGISKDRKKLEAKFLKVYDLTCPLVNQESHKEISIDLEPYVSGDYSDVIANAESGVFLGDQERINVSQYVNQNIVLSYGRTYTIIAPGDIVDSDPNNPDPHLAQTENPSIRTLKVDYGEEVNQPFYIGYHLSGQSNVITQTNVYFVRGEKDDAELNHIVYSGFRAQEDEKYLLGYLLVGFGLSTPSVVISNGAMIPVYSLPNLMQSGGCTTRTAYDRAGSGTDIFAAESDVVAAVEGVKTSAGLENNRNIIVATGRTWIDITLPEGYYNTPDPDVKITKTYTISRPIFSHPELIGLDTEKWEIFTNGENKLKVEGGRTARIPIDIKKVPNSGYQKVDVGIQIGTESESKVVETFYLGNAIKKIGIDPDENIYSGNVLIYEEPTNLFYPGAIRRGVWNGPVGGPHRWQVTNYGPAYNSIEYEPYKLMTTKITSISSISFDEIGVYDGTLNRSTSEFSWESSKNTDKLIHFEQVSSRNEYDTPGFCSRYVPEIRNYEATYKLVKRDDYFPQYPVGKLEISGASEKLYLYYMPANPYILGAASKKHYIQITQEDLNKLSAYQSDPTNNPAPIKEGSFELRSNFYYLDMLSSLGENASMSINGEEGVNDLSMESARYLYHYDGDIRDVEHGDLFGSNSAFTTITLTHTTSQIDYESAVRIDYEFDLSKWAGNVSDTSKNYIAELYIQDDGHHRSVFADVPGVPTINMGTWYYSGYQWEDGKCPWGEQYYMYNYSHEYVDSFNVPGPQYPNDNDDTYLYMRAGTHSSIQTIRWLVTRCQIRATSNPRGAESDLSVSVYGTNNYPWEIYGGYGLNEFYIESPFVSISRAEYNTDHTRTTAYVSVENNTSREAISSTDPIEEKYYKTRTCYIRTYEAGGNDPQFLNIEQQPSSGYVYYMSDSCPGGFYCASQGAGTSALISDTVTLSKAAGSKEVYFEYLSASDLAGYMENNSTATFQSYLNDTDRERINWRDTIYDEEDPEEVISTPIFEIETEGELGERHTVDFEYSSESVGKVGKITFTFTENTADESKAGVFRLIRKDNRAVILEINLVQPGNEVIASFSGLINSAGEGRFFITSEYRFGELSFSGPETPPKAAGSVGGQWQFQVQYPENHTPSLISRVLTVKCSQVPDKEYNVAIPQGFWGIRIKRKTDADWSSRYDASGKYIFGDSEPYESLDTKYVFQYVHSEPRAAEGEELYTVLEDQPAVMLIDNGYGGDYKISDIEIVSCNYQIYSPGDTQYEVSDVCASVSTDVVYNGTPDDPYPYVHTLATIYEDKKELGLALVAEVELGMLYSTGMNYIAAGNTVQGGDTKLKATNKIQIWYKI